LGKSKADADDGVDACGQVLTRRKFDVEKRQGRQISGPFRSAFLD